MSKASQSSGISSFGIIVLVRRDTSINLTCINKSFNSFSIIVKLYGRGLYGIDTARKNRKEMPEMPFDRNMKRGDFEYLYFDKVACCKWLNRCPVRMLFSNVEGMEAIKIPNKG